MRSPSPSSDGEPSAISSAAASFYSWPEQAIPYFTTDTAAALRAVELHCDVLLKATKVEGVYEQDPLLHPAARKYTSLSYTEALKREVEVMDGAAVALCKENDLPIIVFNLAPGNIERVVQGEHLGTIVAGDVSAVLAGRIELS